MKAELDSWLPGAPVSDRSVNCDRSGTEMVACPALIRGREEWGIFCTSARISLKALDGSTTCAGRSSGFSPASWQAFFQISSVKPSTKILAPLAQQGFKFTPFSKSRRPESDWLTALSKLAGVRWNVTTHASSPIVEGMCSLWMVDANCASTNFCASSGKISVGGSSWKTSWVLMLFTSAASFHSLTSVGFLALAACLVCPAYPVPIPQTWRPAGTPKLASYHPEWSPTDPAMQ